MSEKRHAPREKTLVAFASFVLLVLVIINISGWVLWHFTSDLLVDLLDRHLSAISTLVSRRLDGEALMRLKPGDEGTATYTQLHRELAGHRTNFRLADLIVFDADNRVLASAATTGSIGLVNPALVLDNDEILDAWTGKPRITPVIERGANMLKTGYAPITDGLGHVVAILGVETDVRFFETLALLRNGLVFAGVLALVAVAALALLFRRLLRDLLVAEEQGQETERLALVGRLSAQICHEIRNPLSVISASSEYVVRRLDKLGISDGTVRELSGYIVSETDRLNDIVTRFLEVARRPQLERKPEKLETLLLPLASLVRADLEKAGVQFEAELDHAGVYVEMDVGSLRQVLLNAILNAKDALLDSPTKRITLAVDPVRDGRVTVRVDDTGPGVPAEVEAQAFEPFVTSKAAGTGLGLFVAKRIVVEHDGEVRLERLPEGGTRFVIELPVCSGAARPD